MHWAELYSLAVLERDPTKFPTKAEAAQTAIHEELKALAQRADRNAEEERKALEEALHNLKILIQEIQQGA